MNQRVAIAIEENGTEERVAEHFGRCSKFYVCELNEQKKVLKTETFFNPLAGEHSGACQLPGYVKQFNVDTIIAGGMGQKAVSNFLGFGIDVITAPGLLADDALKEFVQGKLVGYEACKHDHGHDNSCH
ncbi:MAG: dinitrogenase iron-molybdenum cofactor [Ignavibacteriae bacterium HGW-Ignavibacteriae-2]|jgi:predicted Fe-Mo cluster-binding NifX family protein|nr:MAG: dinitrogenase iron-molybdenum cofactor [Ignavibacteriae bacterium HGW-Ignavibacteriae-2]